MLWYHLLFGFAVFLVQYTVNNLASQQWLNQASHRLIPLWFIHLVGLLRCSFTFLGSWNPSSAECIFLDLLSIQCHDLCDVELLCIRHGLCAHKLDWHAFKSRFPSTPARHVVYVWFGICVAQWACHASIFSHRNRSLLPWPTPGAATWEANEISCSAACIIPESLFG
jgi:hypothetical protein